MLFQASFLWIEESNTVAKFIRGAHGLHALQNTLASSPHDSVAHTSAPSNLIPNDGLLHAIEALSLWTVLTFLCSISLNIMLWKWKSSFDEQSNGSGDDDVLLDEDIHGMDLVNIDSRKKKKKKRAKSDRKTDAAKHDASPVRFQREDDVSVTMHDL